MQYQLSPILYLFTSTSAAPSAPVSVWSANAVATVSACFCLDVATPAPICSDAAGFMSIDVESTFEGDAAEDDDCAKPLELPPQTKP